jgi:hypothetical protein
MNQKTIDDINQEREAQDKEWGPGNDDSHLGWHWNAILTTRLGQFARSLWHGDEQVYRKRLVQIAAVAVAAIEAYDRTPKQYDE